MKREILFTYSLYIHKFPNGKVYVGITSLKINRRWNRGSSYSHNKRMFNAIKKYGWDNIEHIVIKDKLSKNQAAFWEREYINKYNSTDISKGYNTSPGGYTGHTVSDISRKKMSNAKKGTKKSSEFCEMIRNVHIGNKYRLGEKLSKDTRTKMSISHFGVKAYNSRKIVQIDLENNKIKEWGCIMEVQRELGYLNSCIVACLKGRSKTSYGFKWEYYEDYIV